MKTNILILLFAPTIIFAQVAKKSANNGLQIMPKLAVNLNLLSIFDPHLPTIQSGIMLKLGNRITNEIDFGLPLHGIIKDVDTLPNWFTHFKIKNSIMYSVGKKYFCIGVVLFYTKVDNFSTQGKFTDNTGDYNYTSAEWKKKIWGYGFKIEKFIPCYKRVLLAISSTLGQRFVNAKIFPKTTNSNVVYAKDFGNFFEKVGNYTTPHFEVGFKIVYKII
jgi:hypothetical protein